MESTQTNQGPQAVAAAAPAASDFAIDPNLFAALGYLCGIFAVVGLVVKPYSENAKIKFHAWQSLLFCGTAVCLAIVSGITGAILGMFASLVLKGIGLSALAAIVGLGLSLLSSLFSLAVFVTWVVLMVATATGRQVKLPVLGKHAERLAAR